jgi:uncharacterized protein YwqG
MTTRTAARLSQLAETHLDPDAARRWLALLRPAVQLVPARPGDPVVARLGGTPDLPTGTAWPEWPGHGRLSFVAELDLATLAATGADAGLALPEEGRLLGFYFEPSDTDDAVVLCGDRDTLPGFRLLHVTGTGPTAGAATELTAVQVLTWPDMGHPALEEAGLDELPDTFLEELDELRSEGLGHDGFGRQVGGWASPVQASVELEAAQAALGAATHDDVHHAEALRWRLLLQVDSDWAAGTAWEPATCLYWLARTDGVRPPRLPDDVAFTWQC